MSEKKPVMPRLTCAALAVERGRQRDAEKEHQRGVGRDHAGEVDRCGPPDSSAPPPVAEQEPPTPCDGRSRSIEAQQRGGSQRDGRPYVMSSPTQRKPDENQRERRQSLHPEDEPTHGEDGQQQTGDDTPPWEPAGQQVDEGDGGDDHRQDAQPAAGGRDVEADPTQAGKQHCVGGRGRRKRLRGTSFVIEEAPVLGQVVCVAVGDVGVVERHGGRVLPHPQQHHQAHQEVGERGQRSTRGRGHRALPVLPAAGGKGSGRYSPAPPPGAR